VFLAPGDVVVAIEVKGTLVRGRIPRLSGRDMTQMSAAWVDKADNPGMAELGLQSADVYGGVSVVNFADMTWRTALTADFATLRPIVVTTDRMWQIGFPEANSWSLIRSERLLLVAPTLLARLIIQDALTAGRRRNVYTTLLSAAGQYGFDITSTPT
jgi:hypothetical protein